MGWAAAGAAVIGGVAAYAAGSEQASAAEGAARLQAQSGSEAISEQRRQFDLGREDLAPYRAMGEAALMELGALYGGGTEPGTPGSTEAAKDRFTASPGYEFAFDEGIKALDRSASAGGRMLGGGYGKELIRYGKGMASQQFESYANRLASLAGIGQSAANTGVNAGANTAGNIGNIMTASAANQGNLMTAAGTARASGYAGMGSAATGAIDNWTMLQMLERMGKAA